MCFYMEVNKKKSGMIYGSKNKVNVASKFRENKEI